MSALEQESKIYRYSGPRMDRVADSAIGRADKYPNARVFPERGLEREQEVIIFINPEERKLEVVSLGLKASMLIGQQRSGTINKQQVVDEMGGVPYKKIKRMAQAHDLKLNERG